MENMRETSIFLSIFVSVCVLSYLFPGDRPQPSNYVAEAASNSNSQRKPIFKLEERAKGPLGTAVC